MQRVYIPHSSVQTTHLRTGSTPTLASVSWSQCPFETMVNSCTRTCKRHTPFCDAPGEPRCSSHRTTSMRYSLDCPSAKNVKIGCKPGAVECGSLEDNKLRNNVWLHFKTSHKSRVSEAAMIFPITSRTRVTSSLQTRFVRLNIDWDFEIHSTDPHHFC